ncbi:DUF983 domain-containing protein [Flavobacteriales bacterium]|jgi:uncharacterized protein (DUF983 family)|nr:DUF983 domain-containing protein [Flavobacteriales bacterium]
MFKKGSKVYSIINNKCPQCHEGDFYLTHPYNLKLFGVKNENCKLCNLKFEKEPGFFYGSLYVTYAIGFAIFVTWWITKTILFPEMTIDAMVLWMVVIQFVISPMSLYYAKLIWLNLFVAFKSQEN